jgi:hypothetical protein
MRKSNLTLEERLWSRVTKTETCWLWMGNTSWGYGGISVEGKHKKVHRVSYEILVGPIPEGLVLDHLCRVKSCVNPEHLEPVTQRENVLRGEGRTADNASRTHCKYGHPYSGENLYVRPSRPTERECRACIKESNEQRTR